MGFGYRKRVRLGSGVHMNVSKSGLGFNVGRRGANITFSSRGTFVNLGIPGTGLYYRSKIGGRKKSRRTRYADVDNISSFPVAITVTCVTIFVLFFTYTLIFKTNNYMPYLALVGIILLVIILVYIFKESPEQAAKRQKEERLHVYNSLIKTEADSQKKAYLSVLTYCETYNKDDLKTALTYYSSLPETVKKAFSEMTKSFRSIMGEKRFTNRLWTKQTLDSKKIYGYEKGILTLHTIYLNSSFSYPQLYQGKNINFFPTCLIIDEDKMNFSIKPYNQLKISFYPILVSSTDFIDGAIQVSNRWEHANLDGSKDNRYNNNKQHFVYQFGCLEMDGSYYIFSDIGGSERFFNHLVKFKLALEECEGIYSSNVMQIKSEISVLEDRLRKIIANGDYTSVMKDVLELIYKEGDQNQILDYLSTTYKDLSDIKEESAQVILSYKQISNENGCICVADERNLKYLKDILQISDDELKEAEKYFDSDEVVSNVIKESKSANYSKHHRFDRIIGYGRMIKYILQGKKRGENISPDYDPSLDEEPPMVFDEPVKEEITFGDETES